MTLWMLWAVGVSGLLVLGAALLERFLRAHGMAGRWAWAGAIAAGLSLQLASLTGRTRPSAGDEGAESALALVRLLPASLTEGLGAATRAAPEWLSAFDPWLLAAWIAVSSLLAVGLAGGLRRLGRRARQWPRLTVCGHDVLLSEDFGPALVGVLRPSIVLPRAVLGLEPGALRIVCRHEASHRSARDPSLLLAGASLVVLMPWNAALWWMVARLRQAVELDCDRRVLRAGVDRAEYGNLLLSLGSRGGGLTLDSVPAFAKPISLLERRLTMMTNGVRIGGAPGGVAALVAVAVLVATACGTDAPTTAGAQPEPSVAVVGPTVPIEDMVRRAVRAGTPLVYVDGVRIAGATDAALEGLDPDDIESIEVIKGPAAAAVYGDGASGGVIHIRMKAGA